MRDIPNCVLFVGFPVYKNKKLFQLNIRIERMIYFARLEIPNQNVMDQFFYISLIGLLFIISVSGVLFCFVCFFFGVARARLSKPTV